MIEETTIISMQHKNLLDHESFYNKINKNINNQCIFKKYKINYIFNIYIIINSSLLLYVVPQKCNYYMYCCVEDTFQNLPLNTSALLLNYITLFLFCITYTIQHIREHILKDLLDVNIFMNGDYMEQLLPLLSLSKQNRILHIHVTYKYSTILLICVTFTNIILSGILIHNRYLNFQTYTTFITYIVLCFIKLNRLYRISNTKNHILYSAHLQNTVQFNYLNES